MGVSQVISFNYGAGNHLELKSLLRKSLVLVCISGLVVIALAEATASWVAEVYVGYDEALRDLTAHATRVYMASFLIAGFNMFASAWFTALNNGLVSAIAAFVRTFIFELVCVFVLPLIWGVEGIWLPVNVAEVLALILSFALIVTFRKRYGY